MAAAAVAPCNYRGSSTAGPCGSAVVGRRVFALRPPVRSIFDAAQAGGHAAGVDSSRAPRRRAGGVRNRQREQCPESKQRRKKVSAWVSKRPHLRSSVVRIACPRCEDLLHGNRLRNARCARKNCTPRVVLNTNFGRCRAGTRIFSETSAIGPMRAVRRERVLAPGEIANRRAARAKKFLTSIPPTVA